MICSECDSSVCLCVKDNICSVVVSHDFEDISNIAKTQTTVSNNYLDDENLHVSNFISITDLPMRPSFNDNIHVSCVSLDKLCSNAASFTGSSENIITPPCGENDANSLSSRISGFSLNCLNSHSHDTFQLSSITSENMHVINDNHDGRADTSTGTNTQSHAESQASYDTSVFSQSTDSSF